MGIGSIGIGHRNRAVAGAAISGGSWLSALPASNVLTLDRSEVSRSSDALTTSTRLDLDFGQLRDLRAFAIQGHNLSVDGAWRVTLGTTAGASDVWDSALQAAWYLPFDGAEEWESPNWWGIDDQDWMGHPYTSFILAQQTYQARYLRIQFDDTANADGYVQVARLWAGDLWQPGFNAEYGQEHGWSDPSTVERSASGAPLSIKRRRYRTARINFPALRSGEAAAVSEIRRRAGTVGEVLYVPAPFDYQATQRYGFIGRAADLGPVQSSAWQLYAAPFSLEEWI